MSFDNVIEFWRKVQLDDGLQQKVSPLIDQSDEDRCRGAATVAQEAGFEVTIEEVRAVGQVVAFWELAGADAALQAKLAVAHQQETPQGTLEAIAAVASQTGYQLSHEALSKVTAAMVEGHGVLQGDGDLSEEQLAGVVGGASSGIKASYNLALRKKWAAIAKQGPGQVGAKP